MRNEQFRLPTSRGARNTRILAGGIIGLTLSFAGIASAQPAPPPVPAGLSSEQTASLRTEREALSRERDALVREIAAQNARCSAVVQSNAALWSECASWRERLGRQDSAYRSRLETYRSHLAPRYVRQGVGLVMGTGSIAGYNVPPGSSAEFRARAREMLQRQSRLAGLADVDLDRYNFVIGIAASTEPFLDLTNRVVFDQLRNGQFSTEHQSLYNSLRNREFEHLDCHSNGAMICLAALQNGDIRAGDVVLYGPQVTVESLAMWNALVRDHRIRSLSIVVNENDPVPPVAVMWSHSRGCSYLNLLDSRMALACTAIASTPLFFSASHLRTTLQDLAPAANVQTRQCTAARPTLDCHYMRSYPELSGARQN